MPSDDNVACQKVDRVSRICPYCEKVFESRPKCNRKFCSSSCAARGRKLPRPKRKHASCSVCGKGFDYLESSGYTGQFCSRSCGYIGRQKKPNPKWGKTILHNGYRYIIQEKGPRKAEHRLVMETVLGRKLLRTEHVHHIDGNKLNNAPENLTVLSPSEHTKITFGDTHKAQMNSIRGAIAILKNHGLTIEEVCALYGVNYVYTPAKTCADPDASSYGGSSVLQSMGT